LGNYTTFSGQNQVKNEKTPNFLQKTLAKNFSANYIRNVFTEGNDDETF